MSATPKKPFVITAVAELDSNPQEQVLLGVTIESEDVTARTVTLRLPEAQRPAEFYLRVTNPVSASAPKSTSRRPEPKKVDKDVRFGDSAKGVWGCEPPLMQGNPWEIALSRKSETAPGKWSFHLKVRVKAAEGERFVVALGPDTEAEPKTVVVPKKADVGYAVEFWANEGDLGDLSLGDELTLNWRLEGVEAGKSFLYGPLPRRLTGEAKRSYAIDASKNKGVGLEKVNVVGPATYTLRTQVARTKIEGAGAKADEKVEIVRTLTVGLGMPTYGGNFTVIPEKVFPRGPLACHLSAIEVEKFDLTIAGDAAPIQDKLKSWNNQNFSKAAFVLPYGPGENAPGAKPKGWQLTTEFTPPRRAGKRRLSETDQKVKVDVSTPTRAWLASSKHPKGCPDNAYLALDTTDDAAVSAGDRANAVALTPAPPEDVVALVAGQFRVAQSGPKKPPDVYRSWVAVATKRGLELHVYHDANAYRVQPAVHPKLSWLPKAMGWSDGVPSQAFLGVGAALDVPGAKFHWVVVVSKDADAPTVREFRFPLDQNKAAEAEASLFTSDLLKADGFKKASRVRVIALGSRVYLFGDDVVASYDRTGPRGSWRLVAEPKLARVASDVWELAALPSDNAAEATGHLFAISKLRGLLVRFDVTRGVVGDVHQCASAHDRVVKLRELQELQAEGGHLDPTKADDAAKLNDDNVKLTRTRPLLALLVVGKGLLARNEILAAPKGDKNKDLLRDRAYDPRMNCWVRCGHPFYDVDTKAGVLYASTGDTLYCRDAKGELSYVAGLSHEQLGFLKHGDLKPVAKPTPPAGVWHDDRFRAGETLARGHYILSDNHVYRFGLAGDEDIKLELAKEGEMVFRWLLPSGKGEDTRGHPFKSGVHAARLEANGELVLCGSKGDSLWRASAHGGEFDAAPDPRAHLSMSNGWLWIGSGGRSQYLWRYNSNPASALDVKSWLPPGDYLESADNNHRLTYEGGELVLTQNRKSGTKSTTAIAGAKGGLHRVQLHDTGELIVYKARDEVAWRSGKWGGFTDATPEKKYKDARLVVENNGTAVVQCGGTILWRPAKVYKATMNSGEWLAPEDAIESANGKYRLIYQSDGNLVLYELLSGSWGVSGASTVPLWASHTHNKDPGRTRLDGDGEIYMIGPDQKRVWSSKDFGGYVRSGIANVRLTVSDKGDFRVFSGENETEYHSRWVRLKNENHELHAPSAGNNEKVNFVASGGSWWEYRGRHGDAHFRLVGHNLYLHDDSATWMSGRVKLSDPGSGINWGLERHGSYWSIWSHRAGQYLWAAGGPEPYVTENGGRYANSKAWEILGGLLLEGVLRAQP